MVAGPFGSTEHTLGINGQKTVSIEEKLDVISQLEKVSKLLTYDVVYFINCSWVDTRWQYTFTHKQYIEQHK